ncbi:efflux RND transporter periplasmic adaptor subunit [Methylorubrum salsuginis]|uniref:Membrane fusion protein, multidrug efflux system n=1 Tax=Methylorubrum salsuginis TaxID=414703 RepID=A0A1I3Z2S5_9HYPH|nr:efflux RND transporter periplasmic adaptor subunit [Methylorubrum salsuginis]SFK37919.1 membrane fusion protein, multidrug efflux system [Methylorubrum salsuginis]
MSVFGKGHTARAARWPLLLALLIAPPGLAAETRGAPPAVGTLTVSAQEVTETEKYIGRVQSVSRYSAVARVTSFLNAVVFTEGQDVRKGDVLYRLETAPFEADLASKKGALANIQAQLKLADLNLARSTSLMRSPAGLQQKVDEDQSQEGSLQGQLQGAQADLRTAQINLSYTTIASPIDGKVGRTAITAGNLVSPDTGVLTTVVSQDPMYVVFTIPTRTVIDLRHRLASVGGIDSLKLRIVLPDGRTYAEAGRVDFTDNTISSSTDSFTMRGVFANPSRGQNKAGHAVRELIDGEFVTVIVENPEPVRLVTIPRAAVLTDQRGDYVYVVGADGKAERRNVGLGQPVGNRTTVTSGLKDGETIVTDNLQRVRAGEPVAASPAPGGPGQEGAHEGGR